MSSSVSEQVGCRSLDAISSGHTVGMPMLFGGVLFAPVPCSDGFLHALGHTGSGTSPRGGCWGGIREDVAAINVALPVVTTESTFTARGGFWCLRSLSGPSRRWRWRLPPDQTPRDMRGGLCPVQCDTKPRLSSLALTPQLYLGNVQLIHRRTAHVSDN